MTPQPSPASGSPVSDLTGTFQGQLFHRRFASAGGYATTARLPPVRAAGVLAPPPGLRSPIPRPSFVTHHDAVVVRGRLADHLHHGPTLFVLDQQPTDAHQDREPGALLQPQLGRDDHRLRPRLPPVAGAPSRPWG